MNCYHYDPITGILLGAGQADPDPMSEGAWLYPANSTPVTPPAAGPQQAIIFSAGSWAVVADQRATRYWLPDGSEHTITLLGETVPASASLTPPPPPVAAVMADAMRAINTRCDTALATITAGYPASEVSSWSKQETEARASLADTASPTPMLTALATARGITVPDLATRVVAKSDAFTTIAGTVIGQRQAAEDQINAIVSNPELDDDQKRAALMAFVG